jgi:hypothetical protein
MSVENIITQLATLEAEITGVQAAHDETPESLNEFPCFINYHGRSTLNWGAGEGGKSLHTIICELHVSRAVSEEAELAARPFIKLFRDKLAANTTLNGAVDTINEVRAETVAFIMSAAEQHLGIRFEVDVKETECDITIA